MNIYETKEELLGKVGLFGMGFFAGMEFESFNS